MNISTLKKILLRLFNSYIKKHLSKIIIALFLSFGVAGGTASIAWLLDPAIKKIFVEQNKINAITNTSSYCTCFYY